MGPVTRRSAAEVGEGFTERPVGVWTVRVVTFLCLALAWEAYGRTTHPALFVPPSRVVDGFVELAVRQSRLWVAVVESLSMLLTGFALAIAAGVTLGALIGRFRALDYILDPYISFIYALPSVALLPLYVIWLGIGRSSQVAIVVTISIIPVLLNTIAGAKQVSPELIDVARNYEATRLEILRGVVLPSMLPHIFTGINVGIGAAFIGTILGEMLLVVRGLGGLVIEFSGTFEPNKMMVPLMAIVCLSVLLQAALRIARRRLLPWIDPRER